MAGKAAILFYGFSRLVSVAQRCIAGFESNLVGAVLWFDMFPFTAFQAANNS